MRPIVDARSAVMRSAGLKRLRRENAELRQANEILTSASVFFAAELEFRDSNELDEHLSLITHTRS